MTELKGAAMTRKGQTSALATPTAAKMTKTHAHEPVGLLSQTIHPSSTIRTILPARIRHMNHHDVVFVGENFLQLRELLPSGQLTDVTARFDLGSQILSAKVISSKFEIVAFVDQVIKQEFDEYCVADSEFPPQLLVVSTASCEIVFLYAQDCAPGIVEFRHAKKKLLVDLSLQERYGAHLAVEHESRAMAIAAPHSYCAILTLKEAHEIADEIQSWDPCRASSFSPTLEERSLKIDGIIVEMTFLPPPLDSKHQVILLLLVARRGGTYMEVYSWDTRLGLAYATPASCSGQRLPRTDEDVVMLIPSTKWTSFTIVTQTEIVVWDDILSPLAKRINVPLTDQHSGKRGISTANPIWTQWTRPYRHEAYNKTHDDICLVREDGMLRHYIINHETATKIEALYLPGDLGVNVDKAFASMSTPPALGGGDVFIVGGNLCDGGVFHCPAKMEPIRIQVIANLAPIQDMLVINSHDHNGSRALHDPDIPERVFMCSGEGTSHTAISEIRYGLEAQIGLTAEYNDLSTVSRVWTFTDLASERLIILLSHAQHSTAMSLYPPDLELDVADSENCPGLDLSMPTLAAAQICNMDSSEFAVQITQNTVNVTAFTSERPILSWLHAPTNTVAAAVDGQSGLFATGSKTPSGFEIQLCLIDFRENNLRINVLGAALEVVHAPTVMSFLKHRSMDYTSGQLLVVTTGHGSLQLFSFEPKGLRLVSEHDLTRLVEDPDTCIVSSVVVLDQSDPAQWILLCGLRSGSLLCLNLWIGTPNHTLSDPEDVISRLTLIRKYSMGRISVNVVPDSADSTAALVFCGKELRRIKLLASLETLEHQILEPVSAPILLTSREDPSYQHPTINCISRTGDSSFLQEVGLSGSLISITNDQILFSSFMTQPQAIPRRLQTQGDPKRLTYSNHLNRLIVAMDGAIYNADGTTEKSLTKRRGRPALQFIDPGHQKALLASGTETRATCIGEPGDRVTCIMNWTPSDGKKHYELIVVGIRFDTSEFGDCSGRLLCISAKDTNRNTDLDVKMKYTKKYPGQPLYALCPYDRSSLLICAGKDVVLMHLDLVTKKWAEISRYSLPSPASALTARGPLIYATTAHHSLEILQYKDLKLTLYSSDLQARNTNSIIACDNGTAIVSSTHSGEKGGRITGFGPQAERKESRILFQAALPLMVNHLRAGYILPSSKASSYCAYASTLDGTLYYLTTLQHDEWRILHFVEDLIKQGRHESQRFGRRRQKPCTDLSTPDASDMHVRGDVIAQVLGNDTRGLRDLLRSKTNQEDSYEQFCMLSEAVIGKSERPVEDIVQWSRKFMRSGA